MNTTLQPLFLGRLVESRICPERIGKEKLFEADALPGKIIRFDRLGSVSRKNWTSKDPIETVQSARELYAELGSRYGIVAPVEYVVMGDTVYGITDRIRGHDLSRVEVIPAVARAVESLYETLARYYLDKTLAGHGQYLTDINGLRQYVYGCRDGDLSPSIYLVDTDLYLKDGRVSLCNVVLWFCRLMFDAERRFGFRFIGARKIIWEVLEVPLPPVMTSEHRLLAKQIRDRTAGYLDGSKKMDFPEKDANPVFSSLD